jgi:glycosyltransferase involved in cell wall biosynthesis
MRVCLVSKELAPFHGWGVGTATAELTIALLRAGHEVHLLIDPLPGAAQHGGTHFPGAHFHFLEASGPHHVPCLSTIRPKLIYDTLRTLARQHAFDAICFNDFFADGYFAIEAKRILGEFASTILAVQLHSPIFLLRDVNRQPEFDLEIAAITHMESACIRNADLLLSPSHAILDKLSTLEGLEGTVCGKGLPLIDVCPYALRPESMEALPAPSAGPASGNHEVLFFGRLEHRKGPHTLVQAAQELLESGVDFRVRIVGVDTDAAPGRRSMRDFLERLIRPQWRDRFLFEDNLPRRDIAARIRASTLCCFPAVWDNYPNACLEAMLHGACVIASSAGGMSEMIEHDVSGLLVPPENPGQLADAIRRALADHALCARLGSSAAERVRLLCDPSTVAARFAASIQQAKASRPTTTPSRPAPRISALIPCYNLGTTLPEAIASLRAQSTPVSEIIVLDDGSTDPHTLAVLRALPSKDVRVITQRNAGLSAARNALSAHAAHPWLLFLDADDMLHPDFVATALSAIARDDSLAVVSSFMSCFTTSPDKADLVYAPLGMARDILPVQNTISSSIALVKAESLRRAGGFDTTLHSFEDWDVWCKIIAQGETISIIPRPLILNRIRPDSMLRTLSITSQQHLRAILMNRHLHLASCPTRPARILLGEVSALQHHASRIEADLTSGQRVDQRAQELVSSNVRYQLADRAHAILKQLGVASSVKEALAPLIRRD